MADPAAGPGNETMIRNYARFLSREFNDRQAARDVLDSGIPAHPESGPLLCFELSSVYSTGTLWRRWKTFGRVREQGAD